jgi:hypothetical protein
VVGIGAVRRGLAGVVRRGEAGPGQEWRGLAGKEWHGQARIGLARKGEAGMGSPTQRSLALMRGRNYVAEVTEKWIPGANVRRDLWGFCDVLCLGPDGERVAVQATSASNVSARVKKIADSPLVGVVRKAGIRIFVHGWFKKKHRWQVREVDCS